MSGRRLPDDAERRRQQQSLRDPAYLEMLSGNGSEARVKRFVEEGVWHLVATGRLPRGMTQAQFGSTFMTFFATNMGGWQTSINNAMRDAYMTVFVTKPMSRWPAPETTVRRVLNKLPIIQSIRPAWQTTQVNSLTHFIRQYMQHTHPPRSATRIQRAFRASRNNPYTGLGQRITLRRAGFDPDNSSVALLARRGVMAAPR